MEVDTETQAFVDLYVPRGQTFYTPPATRDIEGDLATIRHLEEVAHQESEMLARLVHVRFIG